MKSEVQELLRSLPSVSALLAQDEVRDWLHGLPRSSVVSAIQTAVDSLRQAILDGRVQQRRWLHFRFDEEKTGEVSEEQVEIHELALTLPSGR